MFEGGGDPGFPLVKRPAAAVGEGAEGVGTEEDEQDVCCAVEGVACCQRLFAGEQFDDGPVAVQAESAAMASLSASSRASRLPG